MDKSTYAIEAEVERVHWWFVGRRRLMADLLDAHGVRKESAILDLGTSTGTNLRLLNELGYTNYQGLDSSDEAIRWCSDKNLGKVHKGDICNLPFRDGEFELVLATDILEHVEDDQRALREINRVLTSGGRAIITVPAFESLWGLQDDVSHHKRRYRMNPVLDRINRAGMVCINSFYFNYLLFLPIWAMRKLIKLFHVRLKSENQINTVMLNRLLTYLFLFDIRTAQKFHVPFGVSIAVIAVKADKSDTADTNASWKQNS